MNLYFNLYLLIFPNIIVLYHLTASKYSIYCVILHDRANHPFSNSISYSFVNSLPVYCSNYTRIIHDSAKCDDQFLELDLSIDNKESLENVLNIESKFHKIGNGIAHDPSNSTKERLKWANFEVRRFTYKLGTVNKQLRKAKAKWNMMYNSFSVDKTVLLEVSKNKRDLCKKLEIFRRLRRNLLRYIKGLKCESDPKIPFIPPKYRSAKVPAYLYSEGVVGIPKKAYRKKPKDTSTVKSIEKANTIDKNDPKSIEKEVMRIIADAKGQAVYKNKLVDKSIVKYRGL